MSFPIGMELVDMYFNTECTLIISRVVQNVLKIENTTKKFGNASLNFTVTDNSHHPPSFLYAYDSLVHLCLIICILSQSC